MSIVSPAVRAVYEAEQDRIRVAKTLAAATARRNELMRKAIDEGDTQATLAAVLRITRSRVGQIIANDHSARENG